MDPYAELADLQARFPRDLTEDEETRAVTLLADASFWLGVRVPGLTESDDEQVLMAAKLLLVTMVSDALMFPPQDTGMESVGPFKFGNLNPESRYRLELDDIISLLRPQRSEAVSMRSPGL